MSYNTGNFCLFQQSGVTSTTVAIAESITPSFSPPAGVLYDSIYGYSLTSSVAPRAVTNFYGLSVSLSMSANAQVVTQAVSLFIQGPTVSSGWVGNAYSLFVTSPSTSGTAGIRKVYTAYIGGPTGIGTTTPINMLDIRGGVAIGSYAGTLSGPDVNSVIVSGAVGVGTSSPNYTVEIAGLLSAGQVFAQRTTIDAQSVILSQGYSQSGFGGGSVPTAAPVAASATALSFNMATINSRSVGFAGGVFDGRYVYASPFASTIIAQYDTFTSFSSSTSYKFFNVSAVDSSIGGFSTASFDGRYIYYIDFSGDLVVYDTFFSFNLTNSYSFVTVSTFISNIQAPYLGSVFDGRYVYFISNGTNNSLANILRYDTYASVSSSSSYSTYNLSSSVNSLAMGFYGAVFDGRYIYYIPNDNTSGLSGALLVRYDSASSFSFAGSYTTFDLLANAVIITAASGFRGGGFDGRFVYLAPQTTTVVRYDTSLTFNATFSYSIFPLNTNTNNAAFDGRYVWFGGRTRALVYDTSLPFTFTTSWSSIAAPYPGNARGGIFDGQFLYFVSSSTSGVMARFRAYPGPPVTNAVIGSSVGNFTVSRSLSFLVNTAGSATAGSAGSMPATAAGFLWVYVNGNPQRIPYF